MMNKRFIPSKAGAQREFSRHNGKTKFQKRKFICLIISQIFLLRKELDNDCRPALTWKSIEREDDQKQFGKGGWMKTIVRMMWLQQWLIVIGRGVDTWHEGLSYVKQVKVNQSGLLN